MGLRPAAAGPGLRGGGRMRRGVGLFGLGVAGTIGVLAALLALIITAAAGPWPCCTVAPAACW